MNEKEKFEMKVLDVWKNNINERKNIALAIEEELGSKKLPTFVFLEAMNEDNALNFGDLKTIEKIAICKGINNIYKNMFKLKDIFTVSELEEYETYTVLDNDSSLLIFDNVIKYSEDYYICACWSPEEEFKARMNKTVRYNFQTQRQATIIKDAFGKIRKKITINKSSVEGIKNTIKKGEYFPPDTLTLNILKTGNNVPNFEYDEDRKRLIIKVNYDPEAYDYTAVDCIDGWHRDTAIFELMNEGFEVDKVFKGFPVNISFIDIKQSAEFVRRQMLANRENDEYMFTLKDDDYNRFIDKINNEIKNNILYKNIAKTREEMLDAEMLTYYDVFRRILKYIEKEEKIEIDRKALLVGTDKYIKMLNEIINELNINNKKVFGKDLDEDDIKLFTTGAIYTGYFAIWQYIYKNDLDVENDAEVYKIINNCAKKMIENKEILKDFKMSTKQYKLTYIYNYFKEMIDN